MSKYNRQMVYQQPLRQSHTSLLAQEEEEDESRPKSRHRTQDQSTAMKGRPSIASRASKRARSLSRPRTKASQSSRPAIGAPKDFRKSDTSQFSDLPADIPEAPLSPVSPISPISPLPRKVAPFRPLQLSIYIPGNELPLLPKFSDDLDDKIPPVPGIERPPQAVLKPRTDSLARSSSTFSVPRKPVASRSNSTEPPRCSTDSTVACTETPSRHRSFSFERMQPFIPEHKPSIATTRSNQEFLDSLNSPLSSSNQPKSAAPETAYSVFRRANEQSARLRTHLEERSNLERKLQEIESIAEERSPVSPISTQQTSPVVQKDAPPLPENQIYIQQSLQQRESIHPTAVVAPVQPTAALAEETSSRKADFIPSRQASQRSSSDSSTLLNEKLADSKTIIPTVTTTISAPDEGSRPSSRSSSAPSSVNPPENQITLGQRLTQWLNRSLTTHHSHLRSRRPTNSNLPRAARYSSGLSIKKGTSSAPNELARPFDDVFPNSRPNTRGTSSGKDDSIDITRTRGTSVSTYVTTRGLSIDIEKFPIPVVRDVGVAM